MGAHTTALVPLSTWCYNSPDICMNGQLVDFGLLAEALIYYDTSLINVSNSHDFGVLLEWFIRQDKFSDFLALVKDGSLKLYDYAFTTNPVEKNGVVSLWSVVDPIQERPNSFEQRFLSSKAVKSILSHTHQREKLYKVLRGNVIEAKADEFGRAIENARHDFEDASRNSLLVQAFVDELYSLKSLGKPPEVLTTIRLSPDTGLKRVSWNIDLNQLKSLAGPSLGFHLGSPLSASGYSNRLIWSAAALGCDLYLSRPLSVLIGDKLFETQDHVDKTHKLIDTLQENVEFPDIRALVNTGQIGLSEVLGIRKKAQKFRNWLQDESGRDRNALIAYHHEVAKETGLATAGRKALSLFGVIGGGAIGSVVGGTIGSAVGPMGTLAGGAAGSAAGGAVGYVFDVASRLGADWRPVVFGTWLKQRIEKVLKEDK